MASESKQLVREKCVGNSHVSLPQELIERLKNMKNWDEYWPSPRISDEERRDLGWLWPVWMDDVHKPEIAEDDADHIVVEKDGLVCEEIKPEGLKKNEEDQK
ncbi:hypothetical protein CDL12_04078 [Handroanthus impetiginosus]|uniref:Uncharacterized protein n=1 Tax=Handroanthus impetiginosus TaxID=429701 RepID=A0A2G9I0E7_9LAMI|nr:hypothetical protein CDL12_04078 [Handroanthus impetiginosus]